MAKIYNSVAELIGGTPLVRLTNIEKKYNLKATLLAKLEYLNPAGSVKDRVAKEIIEDAEKSGKLKPGGTIIEPTSGNTGIGLASIAAAKGYKLIIVIPDTMSVERRNIIKAYGAEIVLTEGKLGMSGAVQKAEELKETIPGSIIAGQFENPANPAAHKKTTGPEIWEDTDGAVDIFVAGVGTGGTLTGTGEYLKEKKPGIKVVAVEPASSPLLSEGRSAG
ncbi:MAG: cysteine synthase family protein, partial [Lachnospiraceae bacterium]|nr:cysteine synthase family protein [Lachnospiraceae bacterium]